VKLKKLAPSGGTPQSYKVTLEAKSKEKPGTKVTAKNVGVSAIARHRDDYGADYAIVVGPDFPTSTEETALAKEIKSDRDKNPGKGITLIRIEDMARLVRLVPAKRVGLDRLKDLFSTCRLPQESKEWIDKLADEKIEKQPYKELLEAIYSEQSKMPMQVVEYGNVVTHLRLKKKIQMSKDEIIQLCRALSKMAPGFVFARRSTVELTMRPDKILEAISSTIREYPEEEQKTIPKVE